MNERSARGPLSFEIAGKKIEPVGLGLEGFVKALGTPLSVFPDRSDDEECIGLWSWGNAFFARQSECVCVEMGASSDALLGEIKVFKEPFAVVCGELGKFDPHLVIWKDGLSSHTFGIKAIAASDSWGRKRVARLWAGRPGALEFRVDVIRELAREVLPSPWERPRKFAEDVFVSLRYGRLPRSDKCVIARQMDLGNWSFALFCLLCAIDENGLALSAKQLQILKELTLELELDDVPEMFSDWLR